MTDIQKTQVTKLRTGGMEYADIGKRLGLPADTVKSYCYRNGLRTASPLPQIENSNDEAEASVCRQCGSPLQQNPKQKRRYFCSDTCRLAWWHEHPEKLKHTATYAFVCGCCGKTFTAYGNSRRKYCSRACYVQARFKGGDSRDG